MYEYLIVTGCDTKHRTHATGLASATKYPSLIIVFCQDGDQKKDKDRDTHGKKKKKRRNCNESHQTTRAPKKKVFTENGPSQVQSSLSRGWAAIPPAGHQCHRCSRYFPTTSSSWGDNQPQRT